MAPQIIYLFLISINLLLAAYLHGKPRDNHNFWYSFVGSLLGFLLLLWGGFFDGFNK